MRVDPNLSRTEKFEVFCRVVDNLAADGRISKAQQRSWTHLFWWNFLPILFMKHPHDLDTEPPSSEQMLLAFGVTILTIIVSAMAIKLAPSGGFTTQKNDNTSHQSIQRRSVQLLTSTPQHPTRRCNLIARG